MFFWVSGLKSLERNSDRVFADPHWSELVFAVVVYRGGQSGVRTFVNDVTVAPPSTAPDASVTVPRMLPVST